METRVLTIMFTDMKGFTSMTSSVSRADMETLLSLQERIVTAAVSHFQGKIIKNLGDGYMASFDSPTNAVLCGERIQKLIRSHNQKASQSKNFELRIGINTGETTVGKNDIFGQAVNLASRIMNDTPPGEVHFSEAVYLGMNKNEVRAVPVALKTFKGIKDKVEVYKVAEEDSLLTKLGLALSANSMVDFEMPKRGPARHLKYSFALLFFFVALSSFSQASEARKEVSNQEILGDSTKEAVKTSLVEASPSASPSEASPAASPTPNLDEELLPIEKPGKRQGQITSKEN